jgi:peptide/nickel transport system permease protein
MHIEFRKQMLRDPWFMTGFGLAFMFFMIALIGPFLAPFDPWDMSFTPLSSPTSLHLLGVNDGGQDIFSELLYGIRNTICFGLLAGLLALATGVLAGLIASLYGGWVDMLIMRAAEVLLAIPSIMILILIAALFRPSPTVLAIILAGMLWPTTAKGIRAQSLSLRERLHIRAARQMGGSTWYILYRHMIPELFPLYLIGFAAKARAAMFMEATLAFLGLFDPARKSLGMMINYALKYYYYGIWWNWLLPPVAALSMLIMSATFLAVSAENVFDPRLKTRWT